MADRLPKATRCTICGWTKKADTGECAGCGVYQCGTCDKLHYGEGTQPCPGGGVTPPRSR
jgi:hypothetical protein